MTLEQAIHTVDELKPNQIERARKIAWLSQLDHRIFHVLMLPRALDAGAPDTFSPYGQDTHPDTVLLAKAPYDEIYRFYLEMQIDLANLEYDKYNNSAALYANAWGQLARACHRKHAPKEPAGAYLKF